MIKREISVQIDNQCNQIFAGILNQFTVRSNKGTVQINERTHSLSINSNQTSRRLHGNKSLQCSSTLVQGFREFKPFRENLDITMHRYELPIGNNSFDKKRTHLNHSACTLNTK